VIYPCILGRGTFGKTRGLGWYCLFMPSFLCVYISCNHYYEHVDDVNLHLWCLVYSPENIFINRLLNKYTTVKVKCWQSANLLDWIGISVSLPVRMVEIYCMLVFNLSPSAVIFLPLTVPQLQKFLQKKKKKDSIIWPKTLFENVIWWQLDKLLGCGLQNEI
jgi:hypothetical protein